MDPAPQRRPRRAALLAAASRSCSSPDLTPRRETTRGPRRRTRAGTRRTPRAAVAGPRCGAELGRQQRIGAHVGERRRADDERVREIRVGRCCQRIGATRRRREQRRPRAAHASGSNNSVASSRGSSLGSRGPPLALRVGHRPRVGRRRMRVAGCRAAPTRLRGARRTAAGAPRRAAPARSAASRAAPTTAHPVAVPVTGVRIEAPVLRALAGPDPARELVDAVVADELAPLDHPAQRDPRRALRDAEQHAPLHQPGAAAGAGACRAAGSRYRPGGERPVEERCREARQYYVLASSVVRV